MQKILTLLFVILIIITVGEVGYYFYVQKTKIIIPFGNSGSSKQGANNSTNPNPSPVCSLPQLLSKVDSALSTIRTNPPEYYQIHRSFINTYAIAGRDPDLQVFAVLEKKGVIENLNFEDPKRPDDFCFLLKRERYSDNHCLKKKDTIVYYLGTDGTQKIIPYTSLKNGETINFSNKIDMGKPNDQPSVETKIQRLSE